MSKKEKILIGIIIFLTIALIVVSYVALHWYKVAVKNYEAIMINWDRACELNEELFQLKQKYNIDTDK